MYDYLNGKLAYADPKVAVVDCGGVGYKCFISALTYRRIYNSEHVRLYTFLNVKEDALDLYGFSDEGERELFLLLISVSGVGPKAAMAVLSELDIAQAVSAVATGNYKILTSVSGIGPKMAQRMCLELKDKISKISVDGRSAENLSQQEGSAEKKEATEVLAALGYSASESAFAVEKCSADNTNDIVKQALRILTQFK